MYVARGRCPKNLLTNFISIWTISWIGHYILILTYLAISIFVVQGVVVPYVMAKVNDSNGGLRCNIICLIIIMRHNDNMHRLELKRVLFG